MKKISLVMSLFNRAKRFFKSFKQAMQFAWDLVRGKAIRFKKVTEVDTIREMVIESVINIRSTGQIIVKEFGGGTRSFYLQEVKF